MGREQGSQAPLPDGRMRAAPPLYCDLDALAASPLVRDPFDFVIVPQFIRPEVFQEVIAAFPKVPGAGSFPLEALDIRGALKTLLDELESPAFEQAIETKFEIGLAPRPKILSLRGHARQKDGSVHTDTATKLISVLVYLNEEWTAAGGRLRLLRSQSLDDTFIEVPPVGGTLVAFRRSDRSWHGHLPHVGPRRVIQLNWMTGPGVVARERGRHRAAAAIKKIAHFFSNPGTRA